MRQLSIRSKIILTILLTGLACLAAGGLIGYRSGNEALESALARQLTAQREIKKQRVLTFIKNQLRVTEAVGGSQEVVNATRLMIDAFRGLDADLQANPAGTQADTAALSDWYTKQFLPRIDKVVGGHPPLESLLPVTAAGRRVQADYIARNSDTPKELLLAAPGGSRYDQAHARVHPMIRRFAKAVGFYDINFIDISSGNVVYTVEKEVDIGSNAFTGPFAQSGYARVVRRALDPKNGGKAVIEDYDLYMPAGFAPQMFAAVPVITEGQTIGVFLAQIDVEALNAMLTDNNEWRLMGEGETGEVQLVGEDHLLRSQSRFMIQDPKAFLAEVQANGTPVAEVERMRALNTSILHLKVHNEAIDRALRNQSGVAQFVDTRGVRAVFAYGPVEVAGLRWAILAKQDTSEAFAPDQRLRRQLMIAGAVAAILLTFLALLCTGLFMRPLRRVIAGMQGLGSKGRAAPIEVSGTDEFAELGGGYNTMAKTIAERDQQLVEAKQKNDDLLRSLYPAGLAERMRGGAEISAESVTNVTVAVTWMDGLDALAVHRNAAETREILNTLLETINATALAHGVEPLRSLGSTCISICGLSAPRLDHAMSTLAWTQSAQAAVQRLGTDWASQISLRFGLASGEVDVLVLNAGHQAFDIFGRTLAVAQRVALDAEPGSVQVHESTFGLLTSVDGFKPMPPIIAPVLGTLKTWTRAVLSRPPSLDPRSPLPAGAE